MLYSINGMSKSIILRYKIFEVKQREIILL